MLWAASIREFLSGGLLYVSDVFKLFNSCPSAAAQCRAVWPHRPSKDRKSIYQVPTPNLHPIRCASQIFRCASQPFGSETRVLEVCMSPKICTQTSLDWWVSQRTVSASPARSFSTKSSGITRSSSLMQYALRRCRGQSFFSRLV